MPAVFFSYSHKDEGIRDQLEVHLAALKRQGMITTWYDRKIVPGREFEQTIDKNLYDADVVLLLVSPDFIASDYCYEREMKQALERHAEGSARIIPVILRPCDWHGLPFGHILATPRDGRAITLWSDRDEAFLDVVTSIKAALRDLNQRSDATPTRNPSSSDAKAAVKASAGSTNCNHAAEGIHGDVHQIALDLGSWRTRLLVESRGVVLDDRSLITFENRSGEIVEAGQASPEIMRNSNRDLRLRRPVQGGIVNDPVFATGMLRLFLKRLHIGKITRALIAFPPSASNADLIMLHRVARRARIREVTFVESTLAAALSGGTEFRKLPVNMIVIIGAGTTSIGVVSGGRTHYSSSIRIAGDEMNLAIADYLRRTRKLLIGDRTAEAIKLELGTACQVSEEANMGISGRNLLTVRPVEVKITQKEVQEALDGCFSQICRGVQIALERLPTELADGISGRGIMITGGGASIKNLAQRLTRETGVPAWIADDPQHSVIAGLGTLVHEDLELLDSSTLSRALL